MSAKSISTQPLSFWNVPIVFQVQATTREEAIKLSKLAMADLKKDYGRYVQPRIDKAWDWYDKKSQVKTKKA
jgi:lysyl-tRNA synthetase class I